MKVSGSAKVKAGSAKVKGSVTATNSVKDDGLGEGEGSGSAMVKGSGSARVKGSDSGRPAGKGSDSVPGSSLPNCRTVSSCAGVRQVDLILSCVVGVGLD